MGLITIEIQIEEEDVKKLLEMIDENKLESSTITIKFNPPIEVKKLWKK